MSRKLALIAGVVVLASVASAQEQKSPPLERLLEVPEGVRQDVESDVKSRMPEPRPEAKPATPSGKNGGPSVSIESERVGTTVPTTGVEERKARVTVGDPDAGDVSISVEGGTRQEVHDRRDPGDPETVGGVRIEVPLPGQKPAKPRKPKQP